MGISFSYMKAENKVDWGFVGARKIHDLRVLPAIKQAPISWASIDKL